MKYFFIILLSLLIPFLTSCRGIDYADKYENVKWTSMDPSIEFTVINKLDEFNEGTLKVDDKTVDILCLWTLSNGLDIFYKDKVDMSSNSLSDDEIAIRGNYKIRNGVVTLTVDLDNVYEYKYKTIIFNMTRL